MQTLGALELSGGGEMGALLRSLDWAQTPLGPLETWPQSLRTTVSLCLSSTFPILIAWGPERVQIYNDAYRPICGELHPRSMGQRFNECWASALPVVGAILDRAQAGQGSYIENLRMFLDRFGYLEEAFMTFSFSPIQDESGGVGGLFHPITETTDKMLGARRTLVLRDLSARMAEAKTLAQIADALAGGAADAALDLPFLALFDLEGETRLVGAIGVAPRSWPVDQLRAPRAPIVELDLAGQLAPWDGNPYPELPRTAMLIPLHPAGAAAPVAALVAGVSARRALDPAYRAFYESLGSAVTTALASVRAYAAEQERAAALAEIDRAKTAFFSNVSHEFRTPLTLLLGPLEHLVDTATSEAQRDELLLAQRNAQRLLKLVNSLLDFSRIEAGRVQASFAPVDLATLTADLASSFRSLLEKAGLALVVDCPPLAAPVWVDRELFEKIVLNLLSNAFKFTFAGEIRVALRPRGDAVELSVHDTGTGIPETELARIFERFHRVQGARGRSYEGSGIGLALVQELVKLHGGQIRAASHVGMGTTFTISLPTGNGHLRPEQRHAERTLASTRADASAYLSEAEQWLAAAPDASSAVPAMPAPRGPSRARVTGRVLLADDNADMRAYVSRLLDGPFVVEAVGDGHAALEAARVRPPDLVLSDVMMPGLDGFGLLAELKADARTTHVPVILLSARAGEEATIEGLRAGASDYLVKPFNARELIARIEGTILISRALRREAEFQQQLVGIVSHDLRNPLNTIGLAAEVLVRTGLDERAGRAATRIQSAASRATRLVRDLLDFTQAQLGGGIPVVVAPLDFHASIAQTIDELRAAYPERELRFTTEGAAGVGAWDADRLSQVVLNLVGNAVKYSATATPIDVHSRADDRGVSFTVRNVGAPIPEADLARLFEPMRRGAHGTDRNAGSIGLGLFIVDHIVRAHHGTIAVRSTAADGTSFTVSLPRTPPAK